jgi:hypothetical protein
MPGKASALAHLPSGKFTANAAWFVLTVIAFNLTRAAGALTDTELLLGAVDRARAAGLVTGPGRAGA